MIMKAFTIEQLYNECKKHVQNGHGNRPILISGDDEGNSFHELFFGFSDFDYDDISYGVHIPKEQYEKEKYIVLG